MNIAIRIPSMLRVYSAGESELTLTGETVGDALAQLAQSHGNLYRSICNETGAIRLHVNVFVNESNVRDREGLDTVLAAGDVITIMPAVSGGSTCRNV